MRNGTCSLLSGHLGLPGAAVPYAVAARFAAPGRPVIALVDDGAFRSGVLNIVTSSWTARSGRTGRPGRRAWRGPAVPAPYGDQAVRCSNFFVYPRSRAPHSRISSSPGDVPWLCPRS
ncbi:thiamine pyrophosphate-dependent enzyme [Streptomyces sp. NPDC007905]|uniref:thiamine pyrophosphate-dependent enzyme n=1 Tax=Streptomyces sp. NPDC007905 TaxID=3364788 RepID=UPI0036E325B1